MDNPPIQPPIPPTPLVSPEPPQKKSLAWLIIPLLIFLLAFGGYFVIQINKFKQQLNQPTSTAAPSPVVVLPSLSPDLTADWQTYTNQKQSYSLKYPTSWQINETGATVDINNKLTLAKDNYIITIYANIQGIGGTAKQVPSIPITVAGLNLFKRDIGDNLYENTGSFEISASDSSPTFKYQDKTYEIYLTYPLAEKGTQAYLANLQTFDLILSTFKFVDSIEPESSPSTPLAKIPTISTDNWKSASNNGVQFKIPPEATCNDNQACTLISWTSEYQGNTLYHNIRVEVKDYLGGSRREQFYQNTKPECHDIYQEASFGPVIALQIAIDGGWCQGGGGGIVTVIGNKLVIVHNLFYNLETKVIDRWDVRDTLVSTLN